MKRTGLRLFVLAAVTVGAAAALALWTPSDTTAEEIALPGDAAAADVAAPGAGRNGKIVGEGSGPFDLLWKGGGVMFFIAICSIVGLAFAMERWLGLRRALHISDGLPDQALAAYRQGGPDEAMRRLAATPVSEAKLLSAALARCEAGYQEMEFAVAHAGARVLYRLQKNVRILGILANVAPLLGLLGTVLGMIEAFDKVADVGALGKQTELAGGIAKALLTTGFGLLVAIPSFLLYHYLKGRAEGLVREMEETAGGFALELDRARPGAGAAAEAPASEGEGGEGAS